MRKHLSKILILTIIVLIGSISSVFAYKIGDTDFGNASWYGPKFQGRPTSSGEPFNRFDLTAAHPSFPFGTVLKVTYLKTNRYVMIRVNDRGPFVEDRLIDLSEKAAEIIGLKTDGVGKVRIEVVQLPDESKKADAAPASFNPSTSLKDPALKNPIGNDAKSFEPSSKVSPEKNDALVTYKVQFGAFNDKKNAIQLAEKLQRQSISCGLFKTTVNDKIVYKVLSLDNFDDEKTGKEIVKKYTQQKIVCFLLLVRM